MPICQRLRLRHWCPKVSSYKYTSGRPAFCVKASSNVMRGSAGVWGLAPSHRRSISYHLHFQRGADDQGKRKEKKDIHMTVDRKISSIESSFRMENILFNGECRRRVEDVLAKNISAADAIAELNKKYSVLEQKMEDQENVLPYSKRS